MSDDSKERAWAPRRGSQQELKAAILAAGLGRRMEPLTSHHLPKPLFPLGGKVPMSEVWVSRLAESGITDVSMNLCVLSDTIKRHFGDGSKLGAQISYVEEQTPTGTLGGVCKQVLGRDAKQVLPTERPPTLPHFSGSTVIAPSGDIVTNFGCDLLEELYDLHKKAGAALTMVLVPVPWNRRKDFGTVLLRDPQDCPGALSLQGAISDFREKDPTSPSNLNNASIYLIERDFLELLDDSRTAADYSLAEPFYDFGQHVFAAMLGRLPYLSLPADYLLWGVQYDGHWFDVGNKRDYLRVNRLLLDGELEIALPFEERPWGYVGREVAMDQSKVTIVPPAIIGNNCVIEPGASIGPYAVVGDDWVVRSGASVRNSVLWERYSFFTESGKEIVAADRALVDRHEILAGVAVDTCIVVGGTIEESIREQTLDVLEDGTLRTLPIDYVPEGRRA